MSKHTPGPWTIRVQPTIAKGGKWYTVDRGDRRSSFGTHEADARLVAASPDLLAFAKHVLLSGACQGIPGLEGYAHLVLATALGGPLEPGPDRADFVRKAIGGAK